MAVLLCVAMLMAGVVARAENGYEFIKYMLSSEDGVRLGYGYSMELDDINTSKTTVIVFDFDDSTIVLLGDNSKGNYEGTSWLLSDTPEPFFDPLMHADYVFPADHDLLRCLLVHQAQLLLGNRFA